MAAGAVLTILSFYVQAVPQVIHETPVIEIGWAFCTVNCVLLTAGTFLMFSIISRSETPKAVASVSEASYGMYLVHIFWLGLWVYVFKTVLPLPTVAAIPVMALCTFFFSYLTVRVLKMLPGSKWIVG